MSVYRKKKKKGGRGYVLNSEIRQMVLLATRTPPQNFRRPAVAIGN